MKLNEKAQNYVRNAIETERCEKYTCIYEKKRKERRSEGKKVEKYEELKQQLNLKAKGFFEEIMGGNVDELQGIDTDRLRAGLRVEIVVDCLIKFKVF